MFSPSCRAALCGVDYADAKAINRSITGKGLSKQAWNIAPKIKLVDDAITPECQQWAFEVHPEVCFWALAGSRPMVHRKKINDGVNKRLDLLRPVLPDIDNDLQNRPSGVAKNDLLDAAAAAWTALRILKGEARRVTKLSKGLQSSIRAHVMQSPASKWCIRSGWQSACSLSFGGFLMLNGSPPPRL